MTPTEFYIRILSIANHLTTASPRIKISKQSWHLPEGSNFTEHLTLDGHRVGRDFMVYKLMAQKFGVIGALLDFSGAMAKIADACPELSGQFREDMRGLAEEFDYKDQQEAWLRVWA